MQAPTPYCAHARQHTVDSAGDGTLHAHVWVVGSIWRETHVALQRHTANSEHTIGAMEDMSRQAKKASTQNALR